MALLDLARLPLRLAREERLPPVGHRENGGNADEGVGQGRFVVPVGADYLD